MNMQSIYDKRNCQCHFCRSKVERRLSHEIREWAIFIALMSGIAIFMFWGWLP